MGAIKKMLLEELDREQAERERDEDEAAEARLNVSHWPAVTQLTPADKELPGNMRCVLATDIEAHFVAIYEDGAWVEAGTSEPIDSHITHWMELPEVPNE